MLGDTHMLAGALAAAVAMQVMGAPAVYWIPAMAAGAVSGLIPDLDMPGSTAGRAIPGFRAIRNGTIMIPLALVTVVGWVLPRFFNVTTLGTTDLTNAWVIPGVLTIVAAMVSWLFKDVFWHRGPTHSFLALAVFSIGIKLLWTSIPLLIWVALVAGYFSHMAIDCFNPTGIAWAWPLTRDKWSVNHSILLLPLRLFVVKAGSPGELLGWRISLGLLLGVLVLLHFTGADVPVIDALKGVTMR